MAPGKAGRHLGDEAHVHGVMVAAGLQRRARRRAQRRGVEIVVAQSVLRQAIERRRGDRAAEGIRRAEAEVVDQHDHDIGRALGRLHLEARRRRRLACVELGVEWPLGLLDRQDGTVRSRRHRGRGADHTHYQADRALQRGMFHSFTPCTTGQLLPQTAHCRVRRARIASEPPAQVAEKTCVVRLSYSPSTRRAKGPTPPL